MRLLERVNIRTNERTYVRTYSHTYVRDRPYIPSTTLLCEGIKNPFFRVGVGGGGGGLELVNFFYKESK